MLVHASHAAQHGHHAILIRTVDTDVVVLAVSLTQELQPEDKLWLAFGTCAREEITLGTSAEASTIRQCRRTCLILVMKELLKVSIPRLAANV